MRGSRFREEVLGLNWGQTPPAPGVMGQVFAVQGRQQDQLLHRVVRKVSCGDAAKVFPPGCGAQSGELPGLLPRHDQDRGAPSGWTQGQGDWNHMGGWWWGEREGGKRDGRRQKEKESEER